MGGKLTLGGHSPGGVNRCQAPARSGSLARMRIDLACAECGNNHFTLDEAHSDLCIVRCRDCGHRIGTLAELKERVAEEVFRRSTRVPLDP